MIILDTHVWVWWSSGSPALSAHALTAIGQADLVGISAVSAWEVAVLVRKGRLTLDRDLAVWVKQALTMPRVVELPLSAGTAVAAEQLAGLHGDPADRFLVATAVHHGCPLVTRDERLRDYPAVRTIW